MQENTEKSPQVQSGFILIELKKGVLTISGKNINGAFFKAIAQAASHTALAGQKGAFNFLLGFTTTILSEFFSIVPESIEPFLNLSKKLIKKIQKKQK